MPLTRSNQKPKHNWQFEAIGTGWSIETPRELDETIKDLIGGQIETFDKTYSRFRDDSLVARIAEEPGTYEFPDNIVGLIDLYYQLYDATNGAVTPLIGDRLSALGYDKDYSFTPKETKRVMSWGEVMQWDGRKVKTSQQITLDFGAAGKGYLVDEVAKVLEINDISDYVIDASGDIRCHSNAAQRVGLENPDDPSTVIGVVDIQNASLCASATNRRRWGNGLHHVIDGRTGEPTNEIVATWVIADSTALADGLATALFFVPPNSLTQLGQFQFVRLFADGHVEYSHDFVGQLFV